MGFNLLSVAVKFYKQKDYDMAEQVVNSLTHSFLMWMEQKAIWCTLSVQLPHYVAR